MNIQTFLPSFFAFGFLCLVDTSFCGARPESRKTPQNAHGSPVVEADGRAITYSRKQTEVLERAARESKAVAPNVPPSMQGGKFMAETSAGTPPFWHMIFGSGIGASNIVIGPTPVAGSAGPEILIGGNGTNNFGGDDFWQSIRHNPTTGNYDAVFVSPVYPATVKRIGLANVIGDGALEIVVMLENGRIYFYDFASKAELGHLDSGVYSLQGSSLMDLNNDGRAELIVTNTADLFVLDGASGLLWQVAGAGGYEVVAGQMDNDAALEIAGTNGVVVDTATQTAQWTRSGGFGVSVRLAPFPGENYQQLIAAQSWDFVYSYDVARQLPRWSISVFDVGAIAVADVESDGMPELIIGDGQWGTVHVHDLMTQQMKWETQNPEHGVTNIAVADVDGDDTADLLWGAGWSSSGPDHLYVAETTGNRSIKWTSPDLQGPFLGPVLGDLDGDGALEMVVCSFGSNSGYDAGRILVFDLATLALRGMSAPVVENRAWTGVGDMKLRDLEGDGRMEIVLAASYIYDGVVEIHGFDTSNTFTRHWINTTRPSGSPFRFVEVADLEGDGTPEIIAGNSVAHSGSEGIYLYIYDYPSGTAPWRSVAFGSGYSSVKGLVVQDLDGNGSKEIAALAGTMNELYTFDGPTRQLRDFVQNTGGALLSSRPSPAGLVLADSSGVGHFLQYANEDHTEVGTHQLGSDLLDGVTVRPDGKLWTGTGGALQLRLPSDYDSVAWETPVVGPGFGRFVAADFRQGEHRVFSAGRHAVSGFVYSVPEPPVMLAAVSRKTHGSAVPFDISLPQAGTPGVECRSGGMGGQHMVIVTFDASVVSGDAAVSSGSGSVAGAPSFNGSEMTVSLSGVINAQRLTVQLTNVTGTNGLTSTAMDIVFDVLEADVNGSGEVNASDIGQTKSQAGQSANAGSFRMDLNLSGGVNASDIGIAKSRSGSALP